MIAIQGNGTTCGPGQGRLPDAGPGGFDEAVLVRRAQLGDGAAFEQLVYAYDRAVLRLALHLTGSEQSAQDIYQEAFLRVYRTLGSFRFGCSFYTWLYRIVTNLCLDYLRKKKMARERSAVDISADGKEYDLLDRVADTRPGSNPERDLLRRDLGHRISRALRRLPHRERLVFELRHYHGMTLRMVAQMLNTSEGAAKNLLFRATQRLRVALADAR